MSADNLVKVRQSRGTSGFPFIQMADRHQSCLHVEMSSVVLDYPDSYMPGTSELIIQAYNEDGLCPAFLSREQVTELRDRLTNWLECQTLEMEPKF